MRLSTYGRLVTLAALFIPVAGALFFLLPAPYGAYVVVLFLLAYAILVPILVVMALALKRIRCPLCGRPGGLGPPPGKGRYHTAFYCPDCGWIDSKGILRMRFFRMGEREGRD